jgi:nucleotide-binding universal stress UspA family protein
MTYVDANGPVVMPEVLDAIRDSYEIVLNKCAAEAKKAGVHFKQETLTGNPAERFSTTPMRTATT